MLSKPEPFVRTITVQLFGLNDTWQRKREYTPLPLPALYPNLPSMLFDKLFAQNKPQSGSLLAVSSDGGEVFVDTK